MLYLILKKKLNCNNTNRFVVVLYVINEMKVKECYSELLTNSQPLWKILKNGTNSIAFSILSK